MSFISPCPSPSLSFSPDLSIVVSNYGILSLFEDTIIDDVIVWSALIAVIPLALFHYAENKRVYSLEESLPNFFRDVAGMNDSGMTLPNAINNVAQGEYGALTAYIRRLNAEMSWSVPFVEALYPLRRRGSGPPLLPVPWTSSPRPRGQGAT